MCKDLCWWTVNRVVKRLRAAEQKPKNILRKRLILAWCRKSNYYIDIFLLTLNKVFGWSRIRKKTTSRIFIRLQLQKSNWIILYIALPSWES